ncbi:cytochrome P450 [Aspergillus clavatus NRRL 1]|uniref:Benzoate 4-monooxygenase cytochrome P450 n=1 Tax=Aspergillus clavatus (strain ATCC 1007 / CBS 513.65 / DSM 816 / NCTC 3887 / NRRL 1 / QM 1276 / 107) TaxID=344612 RepID=A1CS56_ASPCL|nr:benzoate 4-monooxygenase cytochrome P450 [Aspergillus clavatus NRRL 1]EAW08477.1 benzoate 4-monooxygenase cytochrome P450 [Aspergillus clavatus NRRL 1]
MASQFQLRITPDEIHLSDPENLDKVYYVRSRYGKSAPFYNGFGVNSSTFSTASHELHRVKRAALNPFFSRKMVFELEDVVQQKAKKLVTRMQKAFVSSGRIDLHYAYRAISIDVITDYAFNNCFNSLDKEDFGAEFFTVIRDTVPALWFFQQFSFLHDFALNMPLWAARLCNQMLAKLMCYRADLKDQVLRVQASVSSGEKVERKTIFHQLLRPDAADAYTVPTTKQLADEAYVIVTAAADTTGNALTIATYNVVTNPKIYERLTAELKERFPDPEAEMDFAALEKLPYLTAVIKEGLRLSFGVVGRLPRVVPQPGAEFNGYQVPEGTVVSMSSWIMHHNEGLYPNSETFDPERWLNPVTYNTLDKYLFAFGKGTRQCVGMQLAYSELYVTLGRVFRQFDDLKTRKRTKEELIYDDYFSSYHPEAYSKFIFERASR